MTGFDYGFWFPNGTTNPASIDSLSRTYGKKQTNKQI